LIALKELCSYRKERHGRSRSRLKLGPLFIGAVNGRIQKQLLSQHHSPSTPAIFSENIVDIASLCNICHFWSISLSYMGIGKFSDRFLMLFETRRCFRTSTSQTPPPCQKDSLQTSSELFRCDYHTMIPEKSYFWPCRSATSC
jgi:hypothetical protein